VNGAVCNTARRAPQHLWVVIGSPSRVHESRAKFFHTERDIVEAAAVLKGQQLCALSKELDVSGDPYSAILGAAADTALLVVAFQPVDSPV
jgi:hypothetical protein